MAEEKTHFEKLEQVIGEEEEGSPLEEDSLITLSNGIVLKVRGISPFLFRQVEKQFPAPPVPKVFIEEKGREEENYQDPAYLRAVAEVEERKSEAIIDLIVGFGTEVEYVPENIPSPEDNVWIDSLEILLSEKELERIRTNPHIRRIAWIKFVAILTPEDIARITEKVLRKLGVSARDVSESLASFRGNA